jgi:hypothetical protein
MRVLDQFPELALAAGVVRDDAFGSMAERSLCDLSVLCGHGVEIIGNRTFFAGPRWVSETSLSSRPDSALLDLARGVSPIFF